MGFFTKTHAVKKSTISINSGDADLTSLDPPVLSNIPVLSGNEPRRGSFASHISQMKIITEQNAAKFQTDAQKYTSPTDSEFSVKNMTLVSNGLKGEQERNMILEQQVRMLSHQAAMALDRLSDVNKENQTLKDENNRLKRRASHDIKHRFSFGRRQSSYSSTSTNSSSTNHSVFSANKASAYGSKNSSISSIHTNVDQLKTTNDTFFDEIHQNYQKELNTLRKEVLSSQQELQRSKNEIFDLQQQIIDLTQHVHKLEKENKSLLQKISLKKQKRDVELEFYTSQVQLLNTQLALKTNRTVLLAERLQDYGSIEHSLNNTRTVLGL